MPIFQRNRSEYAIIEFARNAVSIVHMRAHDLTRSDANDTLKGKKLDLLDTSDLTSRLLEGLKLLNTRTPLTATVCLPRCVAIMRVIEVPPMGFRELVAAVNLELEGIFGGDKDQYVSDFLSIEGDGDTPQFAIIYSVPKRILDSIQFALNATNIAAERITLSEFGFSWAHSDQGLVHKLTLRGDRLDAVICFRGIVVQSQSFIVDPAQPCDFMQFRGVLRRLHASLPESMQTFSPSLELVLIHSESDNATQDVARFEQSLTEHCTQNNFVLRERSLHEAFRVAHRTVGHAIDFANPQRTVKPLISRRGMLVVLCACVMLSAVTFWVMKQYESAALVAQIQAQKEKLVTTEKKISELAGKVESAARLTQWDECNVDWNEQIKAITGPIRKNNDLYLVRLQMDNRNFWERKPVARLEGRAKASLSILQMTRELGAENPSFSVQPNGIEPNTVDPEFNSQFRVEIQEADERSPTDARQAQVE